LAEGDKLYTSGYIVASPYYVTSSSVSQYGLVNSDTFSSEYALPIDPSSFYFDLYLLHNEWMRRVKYKYFDID
jgi:hypothetical protein